jgi:hypothetical protein
MCKMMSTTGMMIRMSMTNSRRMSVSMTTTVVGRRRTMSMTTVRMLTMSTPTDRKTTINTS